MDIPKDFLSKEFLSQFKTQEDVEAFMSELHVQVYRFMSRCSKARWILI